MTKHEAILRMLAALGISGTAIESFMIAELMAFSPADFVIEYNKNSKESTLVYLGMNLYYVKYK